MSMDLCGVSADVLDSATLAAWWEKLIELVIDLIGDGLDEL